MVTDGLTSRKSDDQAHFPNVLYIHGAKHSNMVTKNDANYPIPPQHVRVIAQFSNPYYVRLVGSLERRHTLALVLVQSLGNNFSERQVDLAVFGVGHDRQGVLHPLVVTVK